MKLMGFDMQLIAVLVPIVGVGAFLWWAGRDMVQDSVSQLQLLKFSSTAYRISVAGFRREIATQKLLV